MIDLNGCDSVSVCAMYIPVLHTVDHFDRLIYSCLHRSDISAYSSVYACVCD